MAKRARRERVCRGYRRRSMWCGRGGMTLVELLLTVAILGIVVGAVVVFETAGLRLWQRGDTQVQVQQNVRVALDRMAREIRNAPLVEEPGWMEKADELKVKDAEDRLVAHFELKDGILQVDRGEGPQPLAEAITSFEVAHEGGNLYRITVTGSAGDQQWRLVTRAARRQP